MAVETENVDANGGTGNDNGGNDNLGNENLANEKVPVSIKDDDLVEITVDGKPERMTYAEAKAGFQRHQDYTRKTQAVSAQRKELENLYSGLTAKQKELLEKETAIDSILGRSKPNKAEENLEDVTTVGQVRK